MINTEPQIAHAATHLHQGGVVACPTEAVWGLSCDPSNETAVDRILSLKKRERGMGLILIAASEQQLAPLLRGLSSSQLATLRESWPGPNTWLVPNNGIAPEWVTGGRTTVALRVTAHPIAAALSSAFGGPMVSTSANPHGMTPAKTAQHVEQYFDDKLDAILPGEVGGSARATSIRDLVSGAIIRP